MTRLEKWYKTRTPTITNGPDCVLANAFDFWGQASEGKVINKLLKVTVNRVI